MTEVAPVSVSRRINASPKEIFALLADPSRHTEIDGSGMLRGAVDLSAVSGVGDRFVMKMHHEDFGDYEMKNDVVEYERDRLIAWEPSRRESADGESWHYRWRYELVPQGDGRTVVTETFDLSRSPEAASEATKEGSVWVEAMTESLEHLDRLCGSAT